MQSPHFHQPVLAAAPEFDVAIRRLFLLIGGGGILVYSYLIGSTEASAGGWLSWDRYAIAALYLGALLLSFTPMIERRWFRRTINLLMLMVYPTEIAHILVVEELSLYYVIGWLLTIQLSMLILWEPWEMWAFVIYQSLLMAIILIGVAPSTADSTFFSLSLLILLLVNVQNQRLRRSNRARLQRQRAQAERNRSTLRSLLDSSGDLIWAVDEHYVIQECNPAYQRLVREAYGIEIAVGDSLHRIPADRSESMHFGPYYRTALKGQSIELEHGLPLTGSYRWFAMAFSPIFDRNHHVIGVSVFARDISERKRMQKDLQTSEARYLHALAGAGDGIWEWDLEHQQVYCSPHLSDMLGLPRASHLSVATWRDMILPHDHEAIERALKAHLRGETDQLYGEFRLRRADGQIRWLQGKGTAMRNPEGHVTRLYGSISDITERKHSDLLLQNILDNSVSGIAALETIRDQAGHVVDFRYKLVNHATAQLLGLPISQIKGRTMLEMLPGHKDNGLFERYTQVVACQKADMFDMHYDLDGIEPTWFQVVAFPLEDGLAIIFTDINERYETQQQLSVLSMVVQKTQSAVVIADRQGRIEWINDAFTQLSGYRYEEVAGQIPGRMLQGPETDPQTVAKIARHLRAHSPVEVELVNHHRNGTPYWISLQISPIFDDQGQLQRFVSIQNEITQRKQAEQALTQAKEAAEAAAQAKSDFLATMSHEIRTPMNAVIGMTGLLLDTSLNEEQRDFVETIRISGDNLLTVINDILDFSKIDAGRLELEEQPFSLVDTIEDVLDLLSTKASEKGLELAYEIDPAVPTFIQSDPTRLSQILVNLLNNGIKFTEQGECTVSVQMEANAAQGDTQRLRFAVRDTGIGIAPEKMERLFKPFSQVDASTTRKYGGTGLGLVICRMLCELMGGQIWIESEVGKGTTFFFTLEVKILPSAQAPHPSLNSQDLQGMEVVLVDDNQTNLTILSRQCERWGMRCHSFLSPIEALSWLSVHPQRCQLAIIDGKMPDLDGLALATRLREQASTAALPIILLSSLTEMGGREHAQLFQAALSKPVRRRQLLKSILLVMGYHRQAQAQSPTKPSHGTTHLPLPCLRILLVEDNVVNQKVALRMLSKIGYQADVAANGLEALKALEMSTYDLVLMDMQMPEMDGLSASREILRRHPIASERPLIIAMTANALKGDRERCLEAGMDDYISKPVKMDRLTEAIERWFVSDGKPKQVVS